MRKTAILAAVMVLCLSFAAAGYGAGAMYNGYPVVNVTVNGQPVTSEVPAIVMDGQTLLPVKAVADALNMNAVYDAKSNTVIVSKKTISQDIKLVGTFNIASDVPWVRNDKNYYAVANSEGYMPLSIVHGSYVAWRNGKAYFDIPGKSSIAITPVEATDYKPGADGIKLHGMVYVKLSAIGLKESFNGSTIQLKAID